MEEGGEDFERTLCQIRECFVFKIPTRSSAAGHRAADWPKEPAMKASLKVASKGKLAIITLANGQTGQIFATCPISDDSAVERTLDSGRYFVLRIKNEQGRHAFIGVAFNERNDAFDFNVALSDHKRDCDREDTATKSAACDAESSAFRDLSLKEGEKITVKIAGATGAKKDRKAGTGTGSGLLAPPPGSRGMLAPPPADRGGVRSFQHTSQQAPSSSSSSSSSTFSSNSLLDQFDVTQTHAPSAIVSEPQPSSVFGFGAPLSGGMPVAFSPQSIQQSTASATAASNDPFGINAAAPFSAYRTAGFGDEPNLLDL